MTNVALKEKRITKEEQLYGWIEKAIFYSKKERGTKLTPKPGEFYTADLGVNVGSEINGIRPFLILTSTNYNDRSGTVTGIPCSRKEFAKKGQIQITEDILEEGELTGIIKTEMITTISKGRLGHYIGRLNRKGITRVGKAMENFFVPMRHSKKERNHYGLQESY